MRRVAQWLGMAGISAMATVAPVTAQAAVRPAQRAYHPVFTRVVGSNLLSGSHFLAISGATPGQIRLIDTSSGRSFVTDQPDCLPDAVGGKWLALTCAHAYAQSDSLYDIARNRTVPFRPSPNCVGQPCDQIAAIGTHWVALAPSCSQPARCPAAFRFENLSTGATRSDPTNATTRVDLDSTRLATPVCRPLTVPRDDTTIEDGTNAGWGSLTLDGGYGIGAGGTGAFLQRCGSRVRMLLTRTTPSYGCGARACAPAHDRTAVVWQSAAGCLKGVFLAGLRRFRIVVPAMVDPLAPRLRFVRADPYTLALARRTLYLQTPGGTVWSARLPTNPQPKRVAWRDRTPRRASAR